MNRSRLIVIGAVLIGLTLGIGGYTFVYAKGYSYLSNDPQGCANCHIMRDHYSAWTRASHRSVAVCNDCHTPPGLVPKYLTKARNGFWHSFYFTTGTYPEPIRIQERNRQVTEAACRNCHEGMVGAMATGHTGRGDEETACIRCHASTGHLH